MTSHVCMSCAKLIANSGLTNLVVHTAPQSHRDPDASYEFLYRCGINLWVRETDPATGKFRLWQAQRTITGSHYVPPQFWEDES